MNQFFWPDSAPTGKLLGDLAEELQAQGHSVQVLAGGGRYEGVPAYPEPKVEIVRLPTVAFSRSPLMRILSWLSFLLMAAWKGCFMPKRDVVVCMTTPPGLSYVGLLIHWLRGSQFWIWEMDLYPDVAEGAGMLVPGSLLHKILRGVMNFPRRHATGIIVLGDCMKARLVSQGISGEKIVIAENWATRSESSPKQSPDAGPLKILYSGNLGVAHEMETIAEVMLRLRNDAGFEFTFAGGGSRRAALEQFAKEHNIQNVRFQGYQDDQGFATCLADSHVGLITLREGCVGSVVPSKMYSLLAAGRPVLFIGPAYASTALQIDRFGCGWHAESGEYDKIESLVRSLAQWRDLVHTASGQAKFAFQTYFEKSIRVQYLSAQLIGQEGLSKAKAA